MDVISDIRSGFLIGCCRDTEGGSLAVPPHHRTVRLPRQSYSHVVSGDSGEGLKLYAFGIARPAGDDSSVGAFNCQRRPNTATSTPATAPTSSAGFGFARRGSRAMARSA